MKQKIWAHRGSSKKAAENTMRAFEQAVMDKADGIEIDVQFTKDREIVVIHDENLSRLAKKNQMVQELDFSELVKLNIAEHWEDGSEFHAAPKLVEVLDLVSRSGIELNIELKNSLYFQPGLEDAVTELVKAHRVEDQVIYSSFNHQSMKYLADRGFGKQCGLLYSCILVDPWEIARKLNVSALHPMLNNLQLPDFAKRAEEENILIHAWTIDKAEYLHMAFLMNLDAIITNVPDEALAIRNTLQEAL